MKKRKYIFGAFACAAILGGLTGCGNDQTGEVATGQQQEQTLAANVETTLKNAKLDGNIDTAKKTITTMLSFTPAPALNGNPQVEGGPDWSLQPLLYDSLCDYSSQPEKVFKPQLLESYTWENKELTMKLKPDLKYSDGSPINADELLNNIYVDQGNLQVQAYAEKIEKLDDLTVKITYTQDSDLIMTYMLKSQLMFPVSDYGQWGTIAKEVFETGREKNDEGNFKLTEAGNEKFNDMLADRNNFLPDIFSIKISGPYKPEKATSSEITLKANPHYRQELEVDTIIGIRPTSTESTAIAIQNQEYDLEGMGLSTDLALKVAESSEDTIRQLVVPEFSQLGFLFNINGYPTDILEVRQAIAHLIDIDAVAPATEPGMVAGDKYGLGLPPSVRDKYLDEEFLATLEEYDYNEERATELLESIGWKKEGNQWIDENGESPEIILAGVGEYPAYVIMGEAAANMLKDFGLNASYTSKEASAYNDYATSGEANMVIDGFGSPQATQHPYEAYNGIWWYGQRMNLEFPEDGPLVWENQLTGEDFNYSEKLYGLLVANDEVAVSAVTQELATFLNDNMWFKPVTEKYYLYRVHNDKLSLTDAPVGEELSDFYWSGTTSSILAKMLKSGEVHYVK